jgi:hypothetical protein
MREQNRAPSQDSFYDFMQRIEGTQHYSGFFLKREHAGHWATYHPLFTIPNFQARSARDWIAAGALREGRNLCTT